MSKKLSYIIPVYNGERYLHQCIDSLLNQGLSKDEYEIICVDDCSKDSSVQILEEYAKANLNIHIIKHEQNKRTGTADNDGIRFAQGKYICVLGQDDWWEPCAAKQLVEIADNESLDMVLFNYNRVDSAGTTLLSRVEVFSNTQVLTGEDFVSTYFKDSIAEYLLGYPWRAIYNKLFLEKCNISFPEGVVYEDTTYMFKAIWHAVRLKAINDYVYNYRLNDHSVTDYEQRYKGYLTYDFSFNTSIELLSLADEVKEKYVKEQLCATAFKSMKSFAYKVVPMSGKEKKIFYENVKKNQNQVMQIASRLPLLYRILVRPVYGYIIASILKPLFIVKHLFVKRTYINR